jgi:DNA repair protein SbcD/Mre11
MSEHGELMGDGATSREPGADGAAGRSDRRATGRVRLLHASDLHVGESVTRDSGVGHVVDLAIDLDVDGVLLVGDIFDHNRVPTEVGQALADELARLDVPVVVLPGNHDCLVPHSIWRRVAVPANVTVIMDDEGEHVELADLDLEVWGRPHPDFDDLRPLDGLPPRGARTWQVAMAHGHVVLGPDDLRRAYQIHPDQIAGSDRDYIALGHWDVPRDMSHGGVTAAYSGSASRNGVYALVTLSIDDGRREVRVEQIPVP